MCVGEIASFLDSSNPSVVSCIGSMVRPPQGPPLGCSSLRSSPEVQEPRAAGDQTRDRRKSSTPINTSPENRFYMKEIGMYTSKTLPSTEEGILLGSDHDVIDNGFSGSFSELIDKKKGYKHPGFLELYDHKDTAAVDISVDLNKGSDCLKLEDQLDFENILPAIVEEKMTDVKILGTLVDLRNSVEYIVKNKFIIGRDKECDILLSDSTVSREHGVLEVNSDGQIIITALNKTVIISKKKIASGSSQVLRDKDELRFGSIILGWRENTEQEVFAKTTVCQSKLDVSGKPTSTISRMDPHLSTPSDYGRIPVTPSAKFSGGTPINLNHNSTQIRHLNPAQISTSPVPMLPPIRPNPQVSNPNLGTKPGPITGNKTSSTGKTPSTGNKTSSTENKTPSIGNKPLSTGKAVPILYQRQRLLEDAHHLFETEGLKAQPRLKRSPSIKVPDKIPKVQISKDYGEGAFRMHHGLFPCVVLVKPELNTKLKDQCGIIDGFLQEHMEIQGIDEDVSLSLDSSF